MLNEEQRRQLKDEGFCIVSDVLSAAELSRARQALERAVTQIHAAGGSTHDQRLDPSAANIRVYNLPERDPVFIELLRHPTALAYVEAVLGSNFIISNFTANIALPGSAPMNMHSDQALVIPAPWHEPWAVNIVWCFDNVDEENGATRYLPESHRYRTFDEVPADAATKMRSFAAPAGSFIVMEGRLWHASGSNTSRDRQRRQAFGYYGADFIRPQINWEAALSADVKAGLDEEGRRLFGLGVMGNTRIGGAITRLKPDE